MKTDAQLQNDVVEELRWKPTCTVQRETEAVSA